MEHELALFEIKVYHCAVIVSFLCIWGLIPPKYCIQYVCEFRITTGPFFPLFFKMSITRWAFLKTA